MSKVCVAVKLTLKSGMRGAFDDAVKPGLATAEGEPGTLMYAYHHDGANENVVWFYEVYADQAAFRISVLDFDGFARIRANDTPPYLLRSCSAPQKGRGAIRGYFFFPL